MKKLLYVILLIFSTLYFTGCASSYSKVSDIKTYQINKKSSVKFDRIIFLDFVMDEEWGRFIYFEKDLQYYSREIFTNLLKEKDIKVSYFFAKNNALSKNTVEKIKQLRKKNNICVIMLRPISSRSVNKVLDYIKYNVQIYNSVNNKKLTLLHKSDFKFDIGRLTASDVFVFDHEKSMENKKKYLLEPLFKKIIDILEKENLLKEKKAN